MENKNNKANFIIKIKENFAFIISLTVILSLVLSFVYNVGFFIPIGGFDVLIYLNAQDYLYGTPPYFIFICITGLASVAKSAILNNSQKQSQKGQVLEDYIIGTVIIALYALTFHLFLNSDYKPYPSAWPRIIAIIGCLFGLLFLYDIAKLYEKKFYSYLGNFAYLIPYYFVILIIVFSFGFASCISKLMISEQRENYLVITNSEIIKDITPLRVLENWIVAFNRNYNRIEIYKKESISKIYITNTTSHSSPSTQSVSAAR